LEDDHDDKDNNKRTIIARVRVWVRDQEIDGILHLVENEPVASHDEKEEEHGIRPSFHGDYDESSDHDNSPVFSIESTRVETTPNVGLENSSHTNNNIGDNEKNLASLPETFDIHSKFSL